MAYARVALPTEPRTLIHRKIANSFASRKVLNPFINIANLQFVEARVSARLKCMLRPSHNLCAPFSISCEKVAAPVLLECAGMRRALLSKYSSEIGTPLALTNVDFSFPVGGG